MKSRLSPKIHICLVICLAGLVSLADRARGSDFDLGETAGTMRIWHRANGLPSDSVTAIIQTRDGFLWAGTSGGLVRFDGVKFTEVQLPVTSSNNPVYVTALCEDSDGCLWVGTQQDGLFRLVHGQTRQFTTGKGLLDNSVTCLAADKQDVVWIGTKSGLNQWTGLGFKSFTTLEGLPDKYVSGVNVARSGTVWITTRVGMSCFTNNRITPYEFQTESQGRSPEYLGAYEDRHGNIWAFGDTYLINLAENKRFNYFRGPESASVRIWSLCEGQKGRLWIGTSGRGLFCFEDDHFQPVIVGENRWSYDVRAIYEDHEGNLWLGTYGGGLVRLRPQSMHVLRVEQGLPNGTPMALALDAGGNVYLGMQHAGLFVRESGKFEQVGGGARLGSQNFIACVCVARDGAVWAGTSGDGLYGWREGREVHFTTANGLSDDNILAVCADKAGGVWASTGAGTVHRFDGRCLARFEGAQGLPGTPVTVMISSASGGLWLGTQDGQILREAEGKFTDLEVSKNLDRRPVLALHEGEQGRLWIGTMGGGLACLTKGAVENWNTGNGLPANIVAGIVEDQVKNLWLATATGIYRVNRLDVDKMLANPRIPLACNWMSAAKTEPASSMYIGGTRAVLSPDGELWFATSEGVLNVDTRQSEIAASEFPVYIESATFNSQPPVSLLTGALWPVAAKRAAPFRVPDDLRSMEIHSTVLSYAAPEDIQLRHKLENFDPDWVDDAGVRTARYGRLPYGSYRFRVAARNTDGDWHEAAEPFAFLVPTPLYYQSWAIVLYGVAAVALVAGIARIVSHRRLRFTLARLEQQQSLERERMRIARDMHDVMGSKLTKISFLSEHAQVDADSSGPLAEKIESIAQTSRDLLKTMDEIVWVVNPRNDTLENLTAYLGHYAVEYFQNTSIECELRLPPDIPHYPLSSETRHNLFLTFEEALNNVLKHSGATKVRVEMAIQGLAFQLVVTDNGKGFVVPDWATINAPKPGGRGGNGLKNMRQRLAALGGECAISSRVGNATVVAIRMRLLQKPS